VQVGIVGLPNVGKSTLFNVLTKMGIPAENFPFCTIDPNSVRFGYKPSMFSDRMYNSRYLIRFIGLKAVFLLQARVNIPDDRFKWLCELYKPKSQVPAFLEICDIAGLVKGAAEGAGLGNAFLSHIMVRSVMFSAEG